MDAIELLETRRSIRDFEKRPVDKETLDRLKALCMRAPSAGNMILYSVVEVEDQAKKERLAELCDNQKMIAAAPLVWVFLADNQKWEDYYRLSGSPERFGIRLRKSGLGDLHLCMQDAIIAAQNAVVAAEALGLGSCYIGDIVENYEELQRLLELPAHAVPACMLILGYPKSKERKAFTPRPTPEGGVFMKDSYHRMTKAELEKQYEGHTEYFTSKGLLSDGKNVADYYYGRKYTSEFMDEMNRSTEVFMYRWKDES